MPEHHRHGHDGRWLDYERLEHLRHPSREALFPRAAIVALLRPAVGMTIADVGAGSGYMLDMLATAVGQVGRVAAVDPSPAARRHLAEQRDQGGWSHVDVGEGTAEATQLGAASTDRMLWQAIYHELDDPAAAFQEALRVLKPHGLLVVVDWDPRHEGQGPPVSERVAVEHAVEGGRQAGFTVLGTSAPSPAIWAVQLERP